MKSTALKGVVLAAGLGTRLRPLTDLWPKPLIPFLGSTPLHLALKRLVAAKIQDIAINTHYLAEKIEASLRNNPLGLHPLLSYESQILGTGGVYNPLRDWQGDSHLVVLNGDVVSNIDIPAVIACHFDTGAIATMALLPDVLPGESAVYHQGKQIIEIGKNGPDGVTRGNFACVQVLSPEFIGLLPRSGQFDIISQGYKKALALNLRVSAFVHDGIWHDIGTIQRYAQGVLDVLAQPEMTKSIGCEFGHFTVTREGGVVENGAYVEEGAIVERSIVLPGARLAACDHVSSMIITPTERISFA